jgi:rare lipoprotein A
MTAGKGVRIIAIVSAVLGLAGCGTTDEDALESGPVPYKVGAPYQVDGVWYYPKVDYEYDETGLASWYGEDFDGLQTANGELFDKNKISAAHKTLPMPSLVRVINLENDRELVVRINDRGPFVDGRIIDLSERAAEELGFQKNGVARVRVEILADESRALAAAGQTETMTASERARPSPVTTVSTEALPPPTADEAAGAVAQSSSAESPAPVLVASAAPAPTMTTIDASPRLVLPSAPRKVYVQAGSFLYFENADALAARLAAVGPTLIARSQLDGQSYYRVLIGPLIDTSVANRMLSEVVMAGQADARIVTN